MYVKSIPECILYSQCEYAFSSVDSCSYTCDIFLHRHWSGRTGRANHSYHYFQAQLTIINGCGN